MARPNKGQHKIPRTYLEAFTDSDGLLWVGDQNLKLFSQKPRNILTESDYYTLKFKTGGGTLNIETKFLGGIEASYARIYRDKIEGKNNLAVEDKARLSIFVASMMGRQPMIRESLEKFFSDVKEQVSHLRNLPDEAKKRMAQMPNFHSGPSIPADEFLRMGEDVGSLHSSMIPGTVIDMAPIIFDMKWCFMVRPDASETFITSDNPFVMVNPEAEARFGRGTFGSAPGLAQKNVEISLPLSSDIALLCGWKLKFDCKYLTVVTEQVRQINRRTMRHARVIISSDKKMLGREIDRIKKFRKERAKSVIS